MSDASSLRRVGRDTIVYGAGVVASRVASAIMLPIYTNVLTPADYGLLQMLTITLDVAAILVSAGMTHGVTRFYFKAQSEAERRAVISSAAVLLIALNLVGSVLLALAADPIWRLVLDEQGARWYVWVAAANFTIGSLSAVPLLYMQIREEALRFSVINLLSVVLGLTFNVIFLVWLRIGPVGILFSAMISGLAIGGSSLIWTLRQTGLQTSRSAMRDLRRFGIPYQFVTAGTFILTFGDRFFLQSSSGLAAVGRYGLAYQFAFLFMGLGPLPFLRAWSPHRHRQLALPPAERDASYNQAFKWLTFMIVSLAVGMSVFAPPTLRIMASPEYFSAATIIPVVLLAYVIQSWTDVMQFGIDVSERTIASSVATWIAAALILVLYWLLIPRYGAMGAAVATLLAFTVRLGLFARAARQLMPITYHWRPHFWAIVLGGLSVACEQMWRPDTVAHQLLAAALCWSGFMLASSFLVLDADDRQRLVQLMRTSPRSLVSKLAAS